MASRAAILAMGNPVALLARAEERETRGFISITLRRPVFGSTANWMLEPPVSTPTSRMMARAALRMIWYSRSVRVWAGATVTESPVWMPMGSKFSMEQITTKLSARSRITSSSYSFQPMTDSSIEDLVDGRKVEAAAHQLLELLHVVGDPPAGAAQGEGGADHRGQAGQVEHGPRLLERLARPRSGAPRGRCGPWPP